MSISSYRRNVARGVTGKKTETCLPAALEQLSPYNRFEPTMYRRYLRFVNWYCGLQGADKRQGNPAYKNMMAEMAWDLGEVDFDDIEFERAESYREFSNIVRRLVRHDYRIAVDVMTEDCIPDIECHAIDLVALGDEYFRGVSTWIPRPLHGYVDLRQVFDEIYIPNEPHRIRYPFNDANITALPPAA